MQANQPTMIVMASQPIYTPPPQKKKEHATPPQKYCLAKGLLTIARPTISLLEF